MTLPVRKLVCYEETVFIEGFKPCSEPWHLFAAAAVVSNPWAGRYCEELKTDIMTLASPLGELLTSKVTGLAGSAENIEAYGKAAVVGLNGEIEHGSGLIHTLRFGNHYREAVEAKSYLAFSNTRGPANCSICVPMMHIHDAGKRSHYLSLQFSIMDAPRDDEIVVVLAGATSGRPHHRIGDRYQDLKELGHDIDNPASV